MIRYALPVRGDDPPEPPAARPMTKTAIVSGALKRVFQS
jgi:hypothetical protein